MDHEISLDCVVNELNKLKVIGEVVTRARMLCDKLIAIAKEKITEGELRFSEFFALTVGFRFAAEVVEARYFMPPIDIIARRRQEVIPRPTLPSDVDELITKIKNYWSCHFPSLNKRAEDKNLPAKADAGKWLDLIMSHKQDLVIERTFLRYHVTNDVVPVTVEEHCGACFVELVTDELERIVRYHEYDLSIETMVEMKEKLPLTYDINELVSRWSTNEKNIIAICKRHDKLWAYINLTKDLRLESFSHKQVALETRKKISNGEVDSDYKYSYCGYARIAKKVAVNGGITLAHFHANSIVDAKRGELTLLWVEPPLCDRVLGVYLQHIEADKPFSPTLYFMQDQIHEFERSREFKKLFPNSKLAHKKSGDRNKAAMHNGKLSGEKRGEESADKWNQIKNPLLELAKDYAPITGNRLAAVAAKKKLITAKEISNIGKKVRADHEFKQYLTVRK